MSSQPALIDEIDDPAIDEIEDMDEFPLAANEKQALERCEAVIARGVQTFIQVGDALAEIRADKLYRMQFTTFEDYCRDKWGIGGSRARQLIGAANVAHEIESVTTVTLSTEREAREIAKSAPADRPAVIARADQLAGDQPRTTRHITQAAAEIAAPGWLCESCGNRITDMRKPMNPICTQCAITRDIERHRAAAQPNIPEVAPTDVPAEYDIIKRRFAAHDITLLSNMQGHHRAYVTRKDGMTGVVTFAWADVLSKLERLEAEPSPDASAPAFHMTCPTCGETIMNGVWGDLKECGSCYHARQRTPAPILSPETSVYDQMTVLCNAQDWAGAQALIDGLPGGALKVRKDFAAQIERAQGAAASPPAPARLPAVPPRPKRPVSADASAVIAYLKQLEVYASALESVIMALQKQVPE